VLNTNELKADRTLFIDDIADNIIGAESVGIRGIHFTDFSTVKHHLEQLL
jgi:FMN phosphatase YigB (HAD superfamily)